MSAETPAPADTPAKIITEEQYHEFMKISEKALEEFITPTQSKQSTATVAFTEQSSTLLVQQSGASVQSMLTTVRVQYRRLAGPPNPPPTFLQRLAKLSKIEPKSKVEHEILTLALYNLRAEFLSTTPKASEDALTEFTEA